MLVDDTVDIISGNLFWLAGGSLQFPYNFSGGPPKLMKGINTFTPHGL